MKLNLIRAAVLAALVLMSSVAGATASALLTGADIADGSLTGIDVRNGSITEVDLSGAVRRRLVSTYAAARRTTPTRVNFNQYVFGPVGYTKIASTTIEVRTTGRIMAHSYVTLSSTATWRPATCALYIVATGSTSILNEDALGATEDIPVIAGAGRSHSTLFTFADVAAGKHDVVLACTADSNQDGTLPAITATGKVMAWTATS